MPLAIEAEGTGENPVSRSNRSYAMFLALSAIIVPHLLRMRVAALINRLDLPDDASRFVYVNIRPGSATGTRRAFRLGARLNIAFCVGPNLWLVTRRHIACSPHTQRL
jgi:hypothetical protein